MKIIGALTIAAGVALAAPAFAQTPDPGTNAWPAVRAAPRPAR